MSSLKSFCAYLLGICTLIVAFAAFKDTVKGGAILLITGVLILPVVWRRVFTAKAVQPISKWLLACAFLYGTFLLGDVQKLKEEKLAAEAKARKQAEEAAYFASNRKAVIAQIREMLDAKEYDSALSIAEKYAHVGDQELSKLNTKAADAKALHDKKMRNNELLSKLMLLKDDQYKERADIYNKLASLGFEQAPEWRKKAADLKDKIARVELIESQFSPWDGSHRGIERRIKSAMNDPDSYEHVKTVYWDLGDRLKVRTTFRGRNAFNALIMNSATGVADLNGNVLALSFD